ncbi:MAG: OadG family protein [Psychrobium sp.]|nr:OadG family protein [Psychrobium sp.]
MDISHDLAIAANLMLLGMVCVFSFLGLLIIAIKIMAKYCPEDVVVPRNKPSNVVSQVEPDVVAAISAAVHKYRQSRN